MKYTDLIIDNNTNATDELYSYACPFDDVQVGDEVLVPFSRSDRKLLGYVAAVSDSPRPEVKRYKQIIEINKAGSITPEAMKTAIWMRDRYICRYIEAVRCFQPSYTLAKRKTKDPFENIEAVPSDPKEPTEEQREALRQITGCIDRREDKVFLLHGVTGSGKTEVYLQACAKVLAEGRNAIVLVPEISLTPQTVGRFVSRFGKGAVGVLHSKLTPAQKSVEYEKIRRGDVKLVIGARSAVFAPFKNIGIIIVDEEHETSYKSDKSPKYDAIEVASKRCLTHNAVLVLGSATPSVSDYYRAKKGLLTLLSLPKRYNGVALPSVRIADMSKEIKNGNRSLFSVHLAEKINECLESKKQVILFLNRRGYASYISCRECGFVLRCAECGISMTYHKDQRACLCHYCGRKVPLPKTCPDCSGNMIGSFGAGTQQLEEKVSELFPGAVCERLDLDTTSKKDGMESVLKRFSKGKTDILIGTQLVAKGLDFANVGLVGIISADVSLNIPDFRSSERSFQLLTQAAGRAGRGDEKGSVVIQTYNPQHPAVTAAARQDYEAFYEREIELRRAVNYPPFADIFQIVLSDEDPQMALQAAGHCAEWLRKCVTRDGNDFAVLGPTISPVNKLSGKTRYQVLIKAGHGHRKDVCALIRKLKTVFVKSTFSKVLLTTDINPYSFM